MALPRAVADDPARTVFRTPGVCQWVVLEGHGRQCATGGAVTTVASDGRATFSIELAPDTVASFIGDRDSRSRAEGYTLYLSQVRIESAGDIRTVAVTGQCVADMQASEWSWVSLNCDARDGRRARYGLGFLAAAPARAP